MDLISNICKLRKRIQCAMLQYKLNFTRYKKLFYFTTREDCRFVRRLENSITIIANNNIFMKTMTIII